jgi:rod shape-determining protein MreC
MRKRLGIPIIVLFLFSLLILLNSSFSPFSFTIGIFQKAMSAPKAFLYDLKTDETKDTPEIIKLKKENARLTKQLVDYAKIKRENEALRSQFDTSGQAQESVLPAQVVGSLGQFNQPHTLIINKGKNQGIKRGSGVIVGNNLVGAIGNVSTHYSEVVLVTNSLFTTIGKTSGTSRGIVKGADDFIVLDRVVITDELKKGDMVITRGELQHDGTGISPDLVIGTITEVNKNQTQPFQTARIDSTVKFGDLDYVFVRR